MKWILFLAFRGTDYIHLAEVWRPMPKLVLDVFRSMPVLVYQSKFLFIKMGRCLHRRDSNLQAHLRGRLYVLELTPKCPDFEAIPPKVSSYIPNFSNFILEWVASISPNRMHHLDLLMFAVACSNLQIKSSKQTQEL